MSDITAHMAQEISQVNKETYEIMYVDKHIVLFRYPFYESDFTYILHYRYNLEHLKNHIESCFYMVKGFSWEKFLKEMTAFNG